MLKRAPQLPLRPLRRVLRGAVLMSSLWLGGAAAAQSSLEACDTGVWGTQPLIEATYSQPTGRYAHGVLGDAIEYGQLNLTYSGGVTRTMRLPQNRVFEDISPRIYDLDGDGRHREVVVVESDSSKGARLVVYNGCGEVAATPHIGRRNRWLAPIGAADLDGDGLVEIAYVDRPHLAKVLRIWRFSDGKLQDVAQAGGYSNHQIGWEYITGGIRDCGQGPEMIVASGDWREVRAVRFDGTKVQSKRLGAYSPTAMTGAMACR